MVRCLLPVLLLASLCWGAPVLSTGYDMLNGETGSWLYRDEIYLPCPGGACTTSQAPLSGGSGKLTDGVIPAFSWNGFPVPTSTPVPWVGWVNIDPTITFNFTGSPVVTRIGLYLDNTPGIGDVRLPDKVNVNGADYQINTDGNFGARWIFFDLPQVASNTMSVRLFRDNNCLGNCWMMLGEVQFEGSREPNGQIPEPATAGLLLGAGILLVALRIRK